MNCSNRPRPPGAILMAAASLVWGAAAQGETPDTADDFRSARSEPSGAEHRPIPEIVVTARPTQLAPPFEATRSSSLRTREDIERLQPNDLFRVIADVPGVSVNGGPLLSGKKFNIRGFGDTEDVSVELDSVPRDFEKYRFGSGVFLEPELLRSVEVWRMPSVRSTPGSIGGAVRAWSNEARDFLQDGAKLGGQVRTGYGDNNQEWHYSGVLAYQPRPSLGLLLSGSVRDSDDVELGNGDRLQNSATDTQTVLTKLSVKPAEDLNFALAYVGWEDSSQQPFDATAGQPGLFGNVQRDVEDDTFSINGRLKGVPGWLDLGFSAGYTNTKVEDEHLPGESLFANDVTGIVNDTYDYDSHAFRLENRLVPTWPLGSLTLWLGADGLWSERDVTRVTQNPSINESLYPDGFNPAQPPGEKSFLGGYLLSEWWIGPVGVRGGVRSTDYEVQALDGAADQLESLGESSKIEFSKTTPEGGIEFQAPYGLTLFYNYVEAFRPPLIDEYFTGGAFSRCLPLFLGGLAPESRACGELYEPEEAETREWGFSLANSADAPRTYRVKVTWFRSDVENTLESITTLDGQVQQPGTEERDGYEIEGDFDAGVVFGRVGYSRTRGNSEGFRSEFTPQGELVSTYYYAQPLYDVPADRLTARIGLRLLDERLELGYQLTDLSARDLVEGGDFPDYRIGKQAGYTLHDVYAAWAPLDALQLRFVGENLASESYQLNNGFGGGAGTEGPGRNLQLVLTLYF